MNAEHPEILAAIEDNPEAVEDYRDGVEGALNFLVGQVLQRVGGHDPGHVQNALKRALGPIQFEEDETYSLHEIPENEMNSSGKLEWVDDDTLALWTEDGQCVEFEYSHVRATDVKYLDRDTGDLYDTREEAEADHD